MHSRSYKLIALCALLVIAMIGISGCGKFGNKFPNQEPTIRITSYEGFDDSELLAPFANQVFLFQQKIFWHASDPDGVITGFAYRVKDQNGNPIATPGNHFIDEDGSDTPQNVLDRFGVGWVFHYKPNADQSLPLSDPASSRTIWTTAKYATINFPAADENGNPLTLESTFEVIAIDNRGDITPLYTPADPADPKRSIAWRKFNATSARPTCTVTTTKGNPNGGMTGSGIRLDFNMRDYDPFIAATPFKYEFKMMKIHPTTGAVIPGTESDWYNSSSPQDQDPDKFLLTRYTSPALTYDIENGVTNTKTKIQARAYDLAGVVSSVSDSSSITFAVKAGYRPKTLVYAEYGKDKVYALGNNHFIDYPDESTLEVLPFTIIGGVQRFATPFFKDTQGRSTAINSSNMKVWLRWGWHGEYGIVPATGPIIPTDNPFDKKIDNVLDRTTDENYFSEITHFDLRLDNAPYNYPPYINSHVTDQDGKEWLRIPLYSPLGQTLVLTSLSSGTHTFEVRCVDLQGEVDPIPATFTFVLEDLLEPAQRNGVLIIDDDFASNATSPEPLVTEKYQQMLSDYSGTKTFIKRTNDLEPGNTFGDLRKRHFATTDLQKYKLIIYHCDNPQQTGSFPNENDGLNLYLRLGGNLLISHTAKFSGDLAVSLDKASERPKMRTLLSYFGLPYVNSPASILGASLNQNAFFQQAIGQNGYPNVDLQYGTTGQPGASFNLLVNNLQGLSPITYFPTVTSGTDVIYGMGIKPVGYPVQGPTQVQYDLYNNKPIGIRRVNSNNKCYLLGFPLSYMQVEDAQALINKVISEVM